MKPRIGWYTFDDLIINKSSIEFIINTDPSIPSSRTDLEIITVAINLLKDPTNWHKEDDRRCEDDDENSQWSFFCALKKASVQVMGEYNHRSSVMQLIRHMIEKEHPGKKWEHRFKDYNNMSETTFDDIKRLMHEAKAAIEDKLSNN